MIGAMRALPRRRGAKPKTNYGLPHQPEIADAEGLPRETIRILE